MAALKGTVQFDCTYNITPHHLEVRGVLANQGREDVGIFNQIRTTLPDGTTLFSPDVAYVELEEGTLLVRKMALPIPQGLNMAAYIPPLTSRLAAGSSHRETGRLPIPVKVMQPFRRALLDGQVTAARPAEAQELTVSFGVFTIEGTLQLVARDPAHLDAYTVVPPGPAVDGQEVLSQSFRLKSPLPVLDYLSVPWT